jgi:hypothetical protein
MEDKREELIKAAEWVLSYKKVCGYFDLHQSNCKWRDPLKELEKLG